jgi:two-component system chemotaxis response regulator CheY
MAEPTLSRTLLVVDDESITRRLVMFTVKPLGIEVLGAGDGQTALEIASRQSIGMILVDINLPEMDGFALIEQLKAIPHLKDVPLVTFTARNHLEDEERARELGAVGFLYKPFSTQELRSLVTEHLGTG